MSYLLQEVKKQYPHISDTDINGMLDLLTRMGDLYRIKDIHYELFIEYENGKTIKELSIDWGYSYVHTSRIIKSFKTLQ